MSKFQIILTAVFGLFIIGGVIVFSAYKGSSGQEVVVSVWGSIPQSDWYTIVESSPFSSNSKSNIKIEYKYRSSDEFDQSFIEALASGDGPDLILLPSSKLLKHSNKILPLPYDVFTQRQYKDAFIEGAEIFMFPDGAMALPVVVDPLVMYWNRSIFNDVQVTLPPKYWDQFYGLSSQISIKDGALNIQRSAVSMGEFSNIRHAKDIIATLAMQASTPIVYWLGSEPKSAWTLNPSNKPILPAESALNFYTEFGNPAKSSYSWNRSLPDSLTYFLGGDLAMYFGPASELSSINIKNPNLNFDVTKIPVPRENGENVTFGDFYGFAITKTSKNPNAAFTVANALALGESAEVISTMMNLPPVRRDLLAERQTDAYKVIFYESAIMARGWLDPEPLETNAVFKSMVESITSGRSRIGDALSRANREIDVLLLGK